MQGLQDQERGSQKLGFIWLTDLLLAHTTFARNYSHINNSNLVSDRCYGSIHQARRDVHCGETATIFLVYDHIMLPHAQSALRT